MSAGLPKYNIINLNDLAKKFSEGEEVSIETLQHKRMLNLSGKEAKLPLKVSNYTALPSQWLECLLRTISLH